MNIPNAILRPLLAVVVCMAVDLGEPEHRVSYSADFPTDAEADEPPYPFTTVDMVKDPRGRTSLYPPIVRRPHADVEAAPAAGTRPETAEDHAAASSSSGAEENHTPALFEPLTHQQKLNMTQQKLTEHAHMAEQDGAAFLSPAKGEVEVLEESLEGSAVADRSGSNSRSRSPKLEEGVASAPTEKPSFDQKRQLAVGRVNAMTVVERDDLFREILGVLQKPFYKEKFGGVINFGGEPRKDLFARRKNSSPLGSSVPQLVVCARLDLTRF